jgi:phospholipid/cholesterol/gamma-HCH transport system substrate-binding protein
MEREANYAAVGAFVLLVIALATAVVFWYSDARDNRDFDRYEVYFEGSVSGLTVGSTVRYLGVDIGRVVTMRIDPRNAARVQVIVDIDDQAPISDKTVAELSLLGVTGLLYIDLLGDAGTKRLSTVVPSERYPVIRSVRSGFDVILSGVPEVMGRASEVAQRASRLLSDANIDALSNLIVNLDAAGRLLPETMQEVGALTSDLRVVAADLQQVAASLRTTTRESAPLIKDTVRRIDTVAENMASATARLDSLLADNAESLTEFSRHGLPEIEQLTRESRAAAAEIAALARSLRENPSQLLFQPEPKGIEVPR